MHACPCILCIIFSEHKDLAANEELILNTVATITNLSFYNNDDSVINKEQVLVAEGKSLCFYVPT